MAEMNVLEQLNRFSSSRAQPTTPEAVPQQDTQPKQVKSKAAEPAKAKPPHPATVRQAQERADSKQVHVGAWLPIDFRRGCKMVQAQTDEDMQALMARLLNAEFQARGIPVVNFVKTEKGS
jgi:hypothetical protein